MRFHRSPRLFAAVMALAAAAGSIVIGSPVAAYQRPNVATPYVAFTHTSEVLTLPSGLTETISVTNGVGSTTVVDTDPSAAFADGTYSPADVVAGPAPVQQVRFRVNRSTPIVLNTYQDAGTVTINFSRPVRNPVLSLKGLYGLTSDFAAPNSGRYMSPRLTIQSGAPATPNWSALTGWNRWTVTPNSVAINPGLTPDNNQFSSSCQPATATSTVKGCGSLQLNGVVKTLTMKLDVIVSQFGVGSTTTNDFTLGWLVASVDEDCSNAPASYGAASHVRSDVSLGASTPADIPTVKSTTACRLDTSPTNANPTLAPLTAADGGKPYAMTVPVTTSTTASTLTGWIDFNVNGTFDPGERATVAVPAGATNATLNWTVPANVTAGSSWARLRLGYDAVAAAATGMSDAGEVEDYPITIAPPPPPLPPGVSCPPVPIWVNSAGGLLNSYDTSGKLLSSVTTTQTGVGTRIYLDIAFTADGSALYAVGYLGPPPPGGPAVMRINPTTGVQIQEVRITGPLGAFANPPNSLSPMPNGLMLAASYDSSQIFTLDPATGVSALYASFPTGYFTSGDFLQLPDGDILALGQLKVAPYTAGVFRIKPDKSVVQIGTLPAAPYGASLSGGDVYLASSQGIAKLAAPFPAGPSTALLTTTEVLSKANSPQWGFNGATSVQDAGICNTVGVTSYTVAKTVLPTGTVNAGDELTYTVTATNTGTQPYNATSAAFTDNLSAVLDDATYVPGSATATAGTASFTGTNLNWIGPLAVAPAPGSTVTVTYKVRVNNPQTGDGVVRNNLAPTGFNGTCVTSASCTTTNNVIPVPPNPALTVVKTAVPASAANVGDTITYSFLVTNTGNVTLTNVTVADTAFSGTGTPPAITCPAGAASMVAGATVTCTATYTVTQADVNAGQVINTATATGNPPSGTPPQSPPSTIDVPITPAPALTVVKSASPPSVSKVGDVVTYSFLVTNTGNVTLTNVTVTDTAFSGSGTPPNITCPAGAASLAPGGTVTCTASYTVTQADVDAGQVTNTAAATGTPPSGPPPQSPPSSTTVPVTPGPALTVVKSAVPTSVSNVGDVIAYSYLVTNTGNVTLTNVAVNETGFTGSGTPPTPTCPPGPLAPGAQVTCTATYTVTQADADAGHVANAAIGTGNPPTGPPPQSPPSTIDVPVVPNPGVTVVKSAVPTSVAQAGDVVTYSYLVTNTGNVTLANVAVNETGFTGTGTPPAPICPAGPLAAGAQITCTATYTVTQADVDAGHVSNTAIATGNPPTGPPAQSPPSTIDVPIAPTPALTVVKSASPATVANAGDVITYSFLVTNTGNVTLANVTVNDTAFTGTGTPLVVTCPAAAASLIPGAQVTCTATYTVTQADVDAGQVTNTAIGIGTPPEGPPPQSPPSTIDVPVTPAPALTVLKSALPAGVTAVGDVVTYSFLVTNTGNVTLTNVSVTDTAFSGTGTAPVPTCPTTTLAPGAQVTCTASYTATQADLDAGQITNTAVATGNPPTGPPPQSPPSSTTVPATPAPGLTIVKSAVPSDAAFFTVGQVITYSFLVTNTGNVTLSNVTVDETAFTGAGTPPVVTCPAAAASLAPQASVTCTGPYTLVQGDIDAGTVSNTATATGTPPSGPPPQSPPSTIDIPGAPTPGITVVKSAVPSSVAVVGDTITYSYLVTNTGNVTLTNVTVSETSFTGTGTPPAPTCPAGPLVPNAQITCTATYTVTQADADAGQITNTAIGTGIPPSGPPPQSPPSTIDVPVVPAPGMTVVKSAVPTTVSAAGEVITYSFLVTNTGNVTLTDVTVTETSFTGTGTAPVPTCPTGPLAPTAQITCTATYTVTQADVDAGKVSNTAIGTGIPPSGPPPQSPPSTIDIPVVPAPALTVLKSANPATVSTVGDVITYSFLVTNTGNVTLTFVTVSDTAFSGTGTPLTVTCPVAAASLAPNAQVTCTAAPYTVTQADVDAGQITNTANATGTPPAGPPPQSPPSSTTVPVTPAPGLTVVKLALPASVSNVGDVITYSYLVTNTGNVTLTNVAVDETAFTGTGTPPAPTCPAGVLPPGGQVTCTASYTVTQADVDAGQVSNTAIATGNPPTGPPPQSPPSTIDVPVTPAPGLTVVKSAVPTSVSNVGDVITYSYLVTNTGNVTLTNVTVNETNFTGTGTPPVPVCPAGPLPPNAQITCTATYTVTAADADAGQVTNTAIGTGTPPSGPPPQSPPSTIDVPVVPSPGMTVVKSAVPATVSAAGEVITYSFLVTNTGNVTLTNATVTDTAFTGTGTPPTPTCPAGPLAVGAQITCTATYTVTQADVDAGKVSNTAIGTGTPPSGPPPQSPPSTIDVPIVPAPGLTVLKAALPATVNAVGDTISYSFLVTNTGNVTLTNVTVADTAFSGTGTPPPVSCPAGAASLAPAAQVVCTATYTVTQADVDAGQVINTAIATGNPPIGPPPQSPPSTIDVPVAPAPGLTVVKTATPDAVTAVGQVIDYSFLVTNTGNVTLTNVTVSDTAFTGTGTPPAITCPAGAASLAAGAAVTCTAKYTVTQADMDAGKVTNTATATGTPPSGPPPQSPPSTIDVPVTPTPAMTIVKSASPSDTASFTVGRVITYSFVVTNTGNVTLSNVTVTDTAFTGTGTPPVPSCPGTVLAPTAQMTCTATYTLTQGDIDAGHVSNTAGATGEPPVGPPPLTPPSTIDIPVVPAPALVILKSASPGNVATAGETVTYTYLVTNTGNVTLTNVTVTETSFSGTGPAPVPTCPAAPLVPGGQVICSATYVVTQADLDAGQITNTATATGTPPSGPPPQSPPSSTTVPVTPTPALSILKSASPSDAASFTVGQVITYSYLLTNTGNTTLTTVTVTETAFTGTGPAPVPVCPAAAASLAPAARVTCTATYTLTQADLDAGKVTNTAGATGTPPSGPPPQSPPSTIDIPSIPTPALTVLKSAMPLTVSNVGDVIDYSFLVTNTGNVTLTNITVTETSFTGTGTPPAPTCPPGSLAPLAQITCTASYTVTQADVDAGKVTNTAIGTGTPPSGPPPQSPPSTIEVPILPIPGLSIVKSASPLDPATFTVGQVITYTYVVTNTGNVTMTNVTVNETSFTGTGTPPVPSCPAGALAPGAQKTCTATYTLTQADIDAGKVANTAGATGTPPVGPPPQVPPSTIDVPGTPAPALTVLKTAAPATLTTVGQTVTYSYLVTNTGNVTLTNVTVNETSFSGTGTPPAPTCPAGPLAPGAQKTCTATYTLTQADVDAGQVTNTGVATGTPPSGTPPLSPPSSTTVPVTPAPALTVVKSASPSDAASFAVGQVISYSFLVTNTGNVTLNNVTVNELEFTGSGTPPVATCPTGALAPAAQKLCTATYMLTEADIDTGKVSNTAGATGTPPSGPPPLSPPSTIDIPVLPAPGLTVVKSASPGAITAAGQTISYSFLVTNTGNVTLANVAVNETAFSGTGSPPVITCPAAPLAAGAQVTCSGSYVVTQDDILAGKVTNTATATGTPPGGTPITSDPSSAEVTVKAVGWLPSTGIGGTWSLVVGIGLVLVMIGSMFVVVARRRVPTFGG